jgi:hypothetical protein
MAGARVATGDVFRVLLDVDQVAFGQVVGKYGKDAYYFAFFERIYSLADQPALSDVVKDRIVLLALSLDARIATGYWETVGHESLPAELPLPAYKEAVGSPDRVDVVDYTGERRRPAVGREVELLPNRKIVAPIRVEKALRALHRLEPWNAAYDELRPAEATTTRRWFRTHS